MEVLVYQNESNDIRYNSSSGGLFTYLSERILADGGVVFGAIFNDYWTVEHTYAEDSKGLDKLRKSKYVSSDLNGALTRVKDFLDENRKVLFTGTPCQIAALKKFLNREYDNLLCAEVVCHGAPKKTAWEKYLTELLAEHNKSRQDISNIDFRDKSTGWDTYCFTITFKDGSKFTERAGSNLFMRLFLSDNIIREGCFKCPYKQPNSQADITMGDLWGVNKLRPEWYDKLGTSLVIANTAKGEQYLSDIPVLGHLTLSDVARYNPALIGCPPKPSDYDRFNQQIKNGRSIMRTGNRLLNPSFLFRVRRKLISIMSRFTKYGK